MPSADTTTTIEYRLHWRNSSPDLEIGYTSKWVGSKDPDAIKSFAADSNWPADMIVTVSTVELTRPPRQQEVIDCSVRALTDWSPKSSVLPDGTEPARRQVARSAARLQMLRDIRAAIDAAIDAGIVSTDDGVGLLLLVQTMVER